MLESPREHKLVFLTVLALLVIVLRETRNGYKLAIKRETIFIHGCGHVNVISGGDLAKTSRVCCVRCQRSCQQRDFNRIACSCVDVIHSISAVSYHF